LTDLSQRVIKGEKGKREGTGVLQKSLLTYHRLTGMVVHEEGRFDPDEIPMKTWAEYEENLWEQGR
jgi:hypothetical protein